MSGEATPDQDPFDVLELQAQLSHCVTFERSATFQPGLSCLGADAIIPRTKKSKSDGPPSGSGPDLAAFELQGHLARPPRPARSPSDLATLELATDHELSDFLKSVEKRAFKRSLYHVRNEESALDIVQDSMMKLAEHYGDKPANELPMLFQRILSNCTLDWFRRQKSRNALFSNMSDFESDGGDGDFDLLETLAAHGTSESTSSAQTVTEKTQIFHQIELEIQRLPLRQREAFLLRYWEELDVAETAAAMGCTEGSVKTHCSRAVHALAKALTAKGLTL